MSLFNRIKQAISRYLERLAKENREQFGGAPDCCRLNRQIPNKKNNGRTIQ